MPVLSFKNSSITFCLQHSAVVMVEVILNARTVDGMPTLRGWGLSFVFHGFKSCRNKLREEDLHNLYSPNTYKVINRGMWGWTG
jgi:hypothetical protein